MTQQKNYGIKGLLKYVEGDATIPGGAGNKFIVHICNDCGGWGKGFVLSLSRKWPKPELSYRNWYRSQKNFKLGEIQDIAVQSDITVINMIAQHGIGPENGVPPGRYDAIEICLEKVAKLAKTNGASIHMPKIGAGLGGLLWEEVEDIVKEKLIDKGISVTIYDLPGTKVKRLAAEKKI